MFIFSQEDAVFYGGEAELEMTVAEPAGHPLSLRLFADTVRARLDDSGNVPRIPPLRYGGELKYKHANWDLYVSSTTAADQNDAGLNEDDTDGYTRVNAGANIHLHTGGVHHTFFIQGENLLDEDIRDCHLVFTQCITSGRIRGYSRLSWSVLRRLIPEAGSKI